MTYENIAIEKRILKVKSTITIKSNKNKTEERSTEKIKQGESRQ